MNKIFEIALVLFLALSITFAQETVLDRTVSSLPLDDLIRMLKTEGKILKKTVAILEIESSSKFTRNVDLNLSDILTTELSRLNKFDLIERNKMEKIIKEQNLQMSGMIDENTAVQIGKLAGAKYIVIGSITSASDTKIDKFAYYLVKVEVGIDLRIIDTETGRIIISEAAVGNDENKIVETSKGVVVSGALDFNVAYTRATRKAVQAAANRLSSISANVGYVIAVKGDEEITIDIGGSLGIKKSDAFIIFRAEKEIVHPITKKAMGWEKIVIGESKIVGIDQQYSNAKITNLKNDLVPKVGDFVVQLVKNGYEEN